MQHGLSEAKQILKLAIPLLLTQITAAIMFFTDTVVASKAGYVEMAAVSVATGIWYPIIFTAQGLIIAITPVIAQLHGSNQNNNNINKMTSSLYQSGYIALLLTLVIFLLFNFVELPLNALSVEEQLKQKSLNYLNYVVLGFLPAALFFALRGFCEGVSLTKPALVVSIIAVIVNVPLNYIFVFGHFGLPELGGAGCGLATAVVQWVMLLSLMVYVAVSKKLKPYGIYQRRHKPNVKEIGHLTKVGTPIALSVFFETTLFACMALFIAPLGALSVAGHQVAYSYSAVVFMIPLSLSMAATIRIGYLKGLGNFESLKLAIKTCFIMAFGFGLVVMSITLLFKQQITSIYTDDLDVITIALGILTITAIYQLPDAIQVMAAGIFKGLKVTKPLFYITFISYWPIGFVLGYVLSRTDIIIPAMGAKGFWVGVVIGLTTASVLFLLKLRTTLYKMNQ